MLKISLKIGAYEYTPISSTCDQKGKGITSDANIFDQADILELQNRYLKKSTGETPDINQDGIFNYSDIVALNQCLRCQGDWQGCQIN